MADMYSRCHASCIGTTSGIRTIPNAVVVRQEWRRIPDVNRNEKEKKKRSKTKKNRCRTPHSSLPLSPSSIAAVYRHTLRGGGFNGKFEVGEGIIECLFSMSTGITSSYQRNNFLETDDMFLEFENDLYNLAGGLSSMGDDSGEFNNFLHFNLGLFHERAQSRLLKLECYVAANWFISMTIGPSTEKLIFLYVVRFNQAIGVCVRKTFLVRCLKWADVGREYIEVIKANLQRFFVLDFNDQAMNRLVEHQMLSTFKEFWGDCHRHFKKYSDHEETRVNPPNILVGRDED
uniref:CACTA en-spm transposon protein n=1 Tax=Cucumis melo TaxID=3656 RepID=A0A9I9EGK7_CUCME